MFAYLDKKENCVHVRSPYAMRFIMARMGAIFKRNTKTWVFNPTYLTLKELQKQGISLSSDLLTIIKNFEDNHKEDGLIKSENYKFITKPYRHQIELVDLFVSKRKAFFLCGVGTGKSKAAIDSMLNINAQKVLVVAPKCTLTNFLRQVKIHSNYDAIVLNSENTIQNLSQPDIQSDIGCVYIINYELLNKFKDTLISFNFDMVVFDEIHFLKDPKSLRSKASFMISRNIKNRLGLSGTLIANNIQDAFGPYKVIDESIFGTIYSQFQNRYLVFSSFNPRMRNIITGTKNIDEFKNAIAKNSLKFDIDDIIDLPPAIHDIREFDLNNNTKSIYDDIKNNIATNCDTSNILKRIIKLQQLCSGFYYDDEGKEVEIGNEKLDFFITTINQINDKIVVFCNFKHSIKEISNLLEKNKIKHLCLDGSTTDRSIYEKFNTNQDIKILIAQSQLGIGWELPYVKYAIFYEMNYSHIQFTQNKGRIRRLSGNINEPRFYIYLQSKNTIENAIYKILQIKDFQAKEALEYVRGK